MLKNEAICLTCGNTVEAHTHEVADLEGNDLVMECWASARAVAISIRGMSITPIRA